MITHAWIEVPGQGRPDIEARSLLAVLPERGIECTRFTRKRMTRGQVPADPHVLVAGTVPTVEAALKRLDVSIPQALDDLPRFAPWLGRRVWPSTLGEVRRRLETMVPVFIKPRGRAKRFTGRLCETPVDLGHVYGVSKRCPVWLSTPIDLVAEWRAYVVRHEVRAIHGYVGDAPAPDAAFIREIDAALGDDAPAGYSIDVGRLRDGRLVLIECNDGYGLGSYDADPVVYTDLIVARWIELMSARTFS